MKSYEISQDRFEKSVRFINVTPVADNSRSSRIEIPISHTSFDSYEKFNKFVFLLLFCNFQWPWYFYLLRIEQPEWDIFKDCEAKELELQKLNPPPLPTYNQRNRSNVSPIEKIISEPGRNSRAEK